jgi:outer membrane protein assembly factor BamB
MKQNLAECKFFLRVPRQLFCFCALIAFSQLKANYGNFNLCLSAQIEPNKLQGKVSRLRLTVAKVNLKGKIMRIPKPIKYVGGFLLVVLAISTALGLANFVERTGNANANVTSETDNLLQYEWPQLQGNPSFTRFSAGPAPEAPDMLWKMNITGIQSSIVAFNGKVFVVTLTAVFALDRTTGSIIWNTTLPQSDWLSVYKIDDAHMVVGNSCLDPETGSILWESANFSARTGPLFTYNVYSPEEKLFYTLVNSTVYAWDFSDPSQPPTVAWETYVSGSNLAGSGIQYGDGKVFPGSYEPHQVALDAKTGDVLWDTETKSSMLFSGSYYEGRFFRGGSHDNLLYCFNASNGDILWEYNPHTEDGYFCVGPAVAYGMVYELNRDGYLYALDIDTGEVVWKYEGPGPLMFPGTPTVADGKIYATTGQTASYANYTSESEFACLDAYTGQPLWKLPIEAFAPRESVAVAYGNLYLIPADVTTMVDSESGDEYSTINQVWAIGTASWPMWRHDPAHSAIGQSGPANLTLRWKYTTNGAVTSSPSIVDGRVYVGSQDKNIYCLDARLGSFIWNFSTNSRLESSPAVVDGKVYVGPDDGNVYCLDAYNGSLIWEHNAGGYIEPDFASSVILRSSPIVVNGRVYVGSQDTNVYCFDANTGDINWTYKTEGYITSSPAVADGAVYIISQEPDSGALYKLDANDGGLIWKKALPYQLTFMGGTDMHASPTVGDGMVFASSNTQEYYGINAATGDIEWTYRDETALEFIVCSTIYKDGLLFLIDKFSIVCVDATNGHAIWSTYLGEELYVSPSYADNKLYVVTDQRSVYVLNATDGDKLGYFGTSSNSWSAPSIYEGKVYVGSEDWNLYCLAGYPAIKTNIAVKLTVPDLALGESTTVTGRLTPGIANESIMLTFIKPDGSEYTAQVTTSEKGNFDFTYTPDVAGKWNVSAQWQTDRGYYTSTQSEQALMEVNAPASASLPGEYVYAVVIAFVIIAIVLLGYVYVKRSRSNKTSFSEDSNVRVAEFFAR